MKVNASDPAAVAQAKRFIEHLYRRHFRRDTTRRVDIRRNRRFVELELVFAYVWRGVELPDDDAGRDHLFIAACHLWHLGRKCGAEAAIKAWASLWTPWCSVEELGQLIERVRSNPRKWTADELAHALGEAVLPFVVRQALGLTTIGSIDLNKEGRLERRGADSKGRSTNRRRLNGAVPRAEWLAANNASRSEPWKPLGMSKATYYRRGLHHETGPNAPKDRVILVCSHLSHRDRDVDESRAHQASRRWTPPLLHGEIILPGNVASGAPSLTHTEGALAYVKQMEQRV